MDTSTLLMAAFICFLVVFAIVWLILDSLGYLVPLCHCKVCGKTIWHKNELYRITIPNDAMISFVLAPPRQPIEHDYHRNCYEEFRKKKNSQ